MLTAVFLLCATTTIFAAAIPKPCCTGHQYSATLHQAFGSYNLQTHTSGAASLTTFKVHYDYDAKMSRVDLEDGTTIIDDHNKGKHYQIKGNNCTQRNTTRQDAMMPTCVPPSARYSGRHTIGDDINYEVDLWYSTGLAFGNLTMAVMPHDCAPVMVGITTANAKMITQTTIFYHNLVYGAPASGTYMIPSSCSGH